MHEGICWFALLQQMCDSLPTSRFHPFHFVSTRWDIAQKNLSSLLQRSNNSIFWFSIHIANNSGSSNLQQMFALGALRHPNAYVYSSFNPERNCVPYPSWVRGNTLQRNDDNARRRQPSSIPRANSLYLRDHGERRHIRQWPDQSKKRSHVAAEG